MSDSPTSNKWRPWLVAVVALLADSASKCWALAELQPGCPQPFINQVLHFHLITNTGGAFGIGHQHKELMVALAVAITGAIAGFVFTRQRSPEGLSFAEEVGFGLILGGATGNIIDRLTVGQVTDFLEFTFISFPVFNVADALIDTGLGIILLKTLTTRPTAEPEQVIEKSNAAPAEHKPADPEPADNE